MLRPDRRFTILLGAALLLSWTACSPSRPDAEISSEGSVNPESAVESEPSELPLGDQENWLEPRYITESLRSIDRLFPTRAVAAGPEPSALGRRTVPFEITYSFDGGVHDLEDFPQRTRTTGLLVLHDGVILHEGYYRGADEGSRFLSMSVAKSFTATLVGLARGEGLIESFNDPVTDYLPELEGTGYDGVSIKHILQMSSGIDFVEEYDDPESDIARLGAACFGGPERIEQVASTYGRGSEPGSVFHYASVDTAILGWLVRVVSGKNLSEYMEEKLWRPLGAEADGFWVLDQEGAGGVECALGGFNARVRDYGRFGLLMAYDGLWNGERLLPEGWVSEATVPDSPQVAPGKLYQGYKLGYQYQWWTFPDPDHSFTAEGIHGQLLMVNPVLDLVLVKTSDWEAAWDDEMEYETWALWDAIQAWARANQPSD